MSPRSPEGTPFEWNRDDDTTEEVPVGARVPHVTEFVSKDTLRAKTEAFFAGLAGIGERVLETERENGRSLVHDILDGWDNDVRNEVAKLPEVSFETLVRDRWFMQSMVDAIAKGLPEDHRSIASLIASLVLNRTMETVSPELREGVHQDVEGDGLHFLGYAWNGGELTIHGEAGNGVGLRMSGGRVTAEYVRDSAGEMMTGGFLSVEQAEKSLGARMYGGMISAKIAGDFAGDQMQGGAIRVEDAGEFLGGEMGNGLIEANRAKSYVGSQMADGTIRVRFAGGHVGDRMRGGTIETQVCEMAGFEMHGGSIVVDEVRFDAGRRMTGGSLLVTGSVREVGDGMMGGEIQIAGKAQSIGKERHGGKITHTGAGSTFKNLFLKFR